MMLSESKYPFGSEMRATSAANDVSGATTGARTGAAVRADSVAPATSAVRATLRNALTLITLRSSCDADKVRELHGVVRRVHFCVVVEVDVHVHRVSAVRPAAD